MTRPGPPASYREHVSSEAEAVEEKDISTLLPCPFCGSPAKMTRFDQPTAPGLSVRITQIQCDNDELCAVCVDIQHINEAFAVAKWNTRADSESLRTQLATARKALEEMKPLGNYVQHHMGCAVFDKLKRTCDCGLEQIRAAPNSGEQK